MGKRLLSYDPVTKTRTWHDYDHADRKTRIITDQDASKILNFTKAAANTPEYRQQGYKEDFMHIGRVPNNVIIEWKKKYGVDIWNKDDLPKVEKLLNGDYKYLRTVDRI